MVVRRHRDRKLDELQDLRKQAQEGGGLKRIDAQHQRGKPTARLTAVRSRSKKSDNAQWASELRRLHRNKSHGKGTTPSEEIVNTLREERI